MEFKDLIYRRRKELGLTMEEVAKAVGVSKATVKRWESGEIANIRRDKIAILAKALHTTPAYLMGWSDTIHPDLSFSTHEKELILAYRNQPAMQEAVDKLLGVPAPADMDMIADDISKTIKSASKKGISVPTDKK